MTGPKTIENPAVETVRKEKVGRRLQSNLLHIFIFYDALFYQTYSKISAEKLLEPKDTSICIESVEEMLMLWAKKKND